MPDKKYTFLIVDSDPVLRKAEAKLLAEMGHTTLLQANDGTEAWAMFKNFDVDFVVSAWELPEMSGYALLKVIRADMKYNSIPVVLIIENTTKSKVIEAGEAGVSDLLLHPFTADMFQKKIESIIEVEMDPTNVEAEATFEKGTELMQQGKFDDALAEFQKILSIYESAEIYYNMGYIKTAQGEYDEALVCFRKATQINNAFARAYQKMGEVYVKLGRTKEAEEALSRAAEIYMEKNMDKNAEMVLNEVAKISPNTINVYNSLGIIYRRQGRFDLAIKQYDKALRVNSEDENILYNLSRVYLMMKDVDMAHKTIKKSLSINPDFKQARALLESIEMGASIK